MSGSTVLGSESEVLYDTGRLPLWVRLPSLLLALACLALAADVAWSRWAGRPLLSSAPLETPYGWLPAAAAVLLAAGFGQLWVGRKRIVWEPARRRLVTEDRWLLGTRRAGLDGHDLAAVWLRRNRPRGGRSWDLYACDVRGRTHWLTRLYAEAEARAAGGRVAEAAGKLLEEN